MKVTVIIPNWNGKHLLPYCLDSLRRQSFADHEVIVVDNGSTDGSQELIQNAYPEVRLLSLNKNLGFAKACNEGIARSSGKYVALLNNDTEANLEWLEQAVSALEERPDASCVASKILMFDEREIVDACGDYYTPEGFAGKIGHLDSASKFVDRGEVFAASAGAAIYRRSLFEDVGVFDEGFFMVYEDVDLSFRAQLQGHKFLFVPTAVVYHHLSSSIGLDSDASVYYASRNIEFVYIKNMPTKLIARYFLLHIAAEIGLLYHNLRIGKSRPFLRAKVDAARGLPHLLKARQEIRKRSRISERELEAKMRPGWFVRRVRRTVTGKLREDGLPQ